MVRRWSTRSWMSALDRSEKITINVGLVDLGEIDLLVSEGFFANRTDFIRRRSAPARMPLRRRGGDGSPPGAGARDRGYSREALERRGLRSAWWSCACLAWPASPTTSRPSSPARRSRGSRCWARFAARLRSRLPAHPGPGDVRHCRTNPDDRGPAAHPGRAADRGHGAAAAGREGARPAHGPAAPLALRVAPGPGRGRRRASPRAPSRGRGALLRLHADRLLRPAGPARRDAPWGQAGRTGLRGRHAHERASRAARVSGRLPRAVGGGQPRSLLELVRATDQRAGAGSRRSSPASPARSWGSRRRSDSGLRRRAFGRRRHGRRHGRDLPGPVRGGRRALRRSPTAPRTTSVRPSRRCAPEVPPPRPAPCHCSSSTAIGTPSWRRSTPTG